MTKSSAAKLRYMSEYQKRPENVDKRVERNRARREAIREGRASVGDGKDVDHRTPLDKGGGHTRGNRRVVDRDDNRGWRKDHPDMYGKKK